MMYFSTIRRLVTNACRTGALLALPLAAAATNPTLTIRGVGSTGSDVTAFIDNVQIINTATNAVVTGAVSGGGFETPAQTSPLFTYGTTGSGWAISSQAGIARNGSSFGAATAPEGVQVALLQSYQSNNGSVSQVLALGAGKYRVQFQVAQRNCCSTNDQTVEVLLDGASMGTLKPTSNTSYVTFLSNEFVVDPPTITSFNPISGGLGQSVTLTGTNLSNVTSLLVNGVSATSSISSNTATTVTFRVPLGTPATGTTSITTAGGTASSTAFTVMAAPGNALAFDGTDDYVALPTGTALPINNSAYTIEAWIKPTAMGVRGIIGWGNYGTNSQVNALRLTGNGIVNYWWNNDLTVTTGDLTDRWHHVAATFDGTTRTMYLDGVAVGSDVPTGHAVPSANTLRIGSTCPTCGGEYFSGNIDEVRVWTVARTLAQVQTDMRSAATVPTTGLVAYFNMDQGTPGGTNTGLNTVYDLANNYAGTLTNFALTGSTSNWVESYAMVVPTATAATSITATSLTANWTAPTTGTVTNYVLDVSTSSTFASVISGSPFTVSGTSRTLTGLTPSTTYYYRVRADKTSVTGQGDFSNTITTATPSNVATLSNLGLGAGAISPTFSSATTSYSLTVASGVASTTLTPTATQANATITVNGTAVASNSATTVALASGSNTISVVVTAQDGTTQMTYTVTVYRCSLQAIVQNVTAYLGTTGTVTVTAAQINNGSTSGCTPITYTMQRLASQQVSEGSILTMTAPAGMTFNAVTFASYGTPTANSNGSYSIGGCHAASSQAVVEAALLNKNSGTISATNGVFGDPCNGTFKALAVQATYGAAAAQATYTCSDLGNSLVLLTATDAAGNKSTAIATITIIDNLAPGAGLGPLPAAPATALANVPEAADYGVLYQLDVPNTSTAFNPNGVPYSVNNASAAIATPNRVAYFMELSNGTTSKWVWASMDNFAGTLTQLGIPNPTTNNVTWHQSVTGLNVFASANAGVTTGTNVGTGRVEMWPWNYGAANSDNVPNASASLYDFGDQPSYNSNYGSFQVHNVTAQQTVLAYNNWGGGGNLGDIGIGTNTDLTGNKHPDWTFTYNAASYTLKRITILVPNVAPFTQLAAVSLDASGSVTVAPSQVYKGNLTDNCGIASMTVTPSTFNCTNLGANQVTLTLTDASGNKTTGTATVTVSVPAITTTTWNGSTNADWNDCRNWSYGQVPTSAISAIIPTGTPNTPTISTGTATVNTLSINANGNLAMLSGTTLQVSGDWTSSSTNSSFGGTVAFVGTTAQTIANTGTALGTVVINKTTGTTQLSQSMAISTSLVMSQGVLTTGAYQVQLASGATITESEANYVTGNVAATRTLSAGSTNLFGGMGLSLAPASGSPAPGSTQVVRTTGTTLTANSGKQSVQRYFNIQPATNTGLNVTMVFSYFDHELNSIPKANLMLFKSTTDTNGPWAPMGGTSNTSTNQVTKAGLTDFSIWTLGNTASPLPVALLDFTAQTQGAAVALAWHTASEVNSNRFEVERSLDGSSFAKLGAVAAHGTTSIAQAYAYRDAQLPIGATTLYYRLRQVDVDGSAHYSPVRIVAVSATGLALYPNPTHSLAVLTGATAHVAVQVLDALGRTVLTTTTDANGMASLDLAAGLPSGVYTVRAGTQAARLILE